MVSPGEADLILSRDLELPGERSAFFARVRAGELVAVLRGAYLPVDEWQKMNERQRYRARILAAAAHASEELIFSHHSAAALWKLPTVDPLPSRVHVLNPLAAGGRSTSVLARHSVGLPESPSRVGGLFATSLARTVVDVARVASFGHSVCLADAALRRKVHPVPDVPRTNVTKEDLARELAKVPLRQGSARAARVVAFADGLADRPGESMSRVSMRTARLPVPRLQAALQGASGRNWTVDFWWPGSNLIGEFDGKYKYTDPEFLAGRTPQDAVYEEKVREDDLRAAGYGMSRWGWKLANSPRLLAAQLRAAGLR